MHTQNNRPIPDSYWVEPGRLLAGEYPRDWVDDKARPKLRRFLEAGVTLFLDLTQEDEAPPGLAMYSLKPYAALLQNEATHLGCSVEYRRMPIQDLGIPTPAEMVHILDTIDAALAADHIIYVHCWGGVGRTGTVVGCYLVRHGLTADEALTKIAHLREGTPDGWKSSPQTDAQRQMIRDWSAGK